MKLPHVLLITAALAILPGSAMAIEEAEYAVTLKDKDFEIREYAAQLVAEVLIMDKFEEAGNAAFKKLFKYISGNNTASNKIAMTAPVAQRQGGEKIAMTSPVGQQATGEGWVVSFMMPAFYTMETIPQPEDKTVVIREIPPYRAATIRYKGTWSEKNYLKHLALLREWIKQNGLQVRGEPVWARYDPPFMPWFMRRNEIIIPLTV